MLNKTGRNAAVMEESGEVDIGGGLLVPKSVDALVKVAYQHSPMKFLTNLLVQGGIFTLQELSTHSLKGGKSPKVPAEVRPMLDPVKLKTDFGKI